jgi:uncharacterized membrane protein YeaQ/YmgE (transglycosylase-associated protein family)
MIYVLVWLVFGLSVGIVAKLLMPGKESGSGSEQLFEMRC